MKPCKLQQIKDEYAQHLDVETWGAYRRDNEITGPIDCTIDELMREYATQEAEIAFQKGYDEGIREGYERGSKHGLGLGVDDGYRLGIKEERERHENIVEFAKKYLDKIGPILDEESRKKHEEMLKKAGYLEGKEEQK